MSAAFSKRHHVQSISEDYIAESTNALESGRHCGSNFFFVFTFFFPSASGVIWLKCCVSIMVSFHYWCIFEEFLKVLKRK